MVSTTTTYYLLLLHVNPRTRVETNQNLLAGWLSAVCWLAGLLAGWLAGWLACSLVGWLDWLVGLAELHLATVAVADAWPNDAKHTKEILKQLSLLLLNCNLCSSI